MEFLPLIFPFAEHKTTEFLLLLRNYSVTSKPSNNRSGVCIRVRIFTEVENPIALTYSTAFIYIILFFENPSED
jgi:hypothetical protein